MPDATRSSTRAPSNCDPKPPARTDQPTGRIQRPKFSTEDDCPVTESIFSPSNTHFESNYETVVTSFEDLNLSRDLLRGIYGYGFEKPSGIQQRAIKPILDGFDTIGQAQSGTGKTATFVIAALQLINYKLRKCQALILAPTRELAQQIQRVVLAFGDYVGVVCHASVGGTDVRDDVNRLLEGVHVVVGTPGRIGDMIHKNFLDISSLRLFVLDEADEMLSRGFLEQIYNICQMIPNTTQITLFSATMTSGVLEVSEKFMRDPKRVLVKNTELTLEGIRQYFVNVGHENNKFSSLLDLYESLTIAQTIIYVNSRRRADTLEEDLMDQKFAVSKIHGELPQSDREQIMKLFRSGSTRILVTTDLLSRGIDVQQVSVVINYDMPSKVETYIHRIGRSGRFGRKGTAINFVVTKELDMINELERHYSTQIQELPSLDYNEAVPAQKQ